MKLQKNFILVFIILIVPITFLVFYAKYKKPSPLASNSISNQEANTEVEKMSETQVSFPPDAELPTSVAKTREALINAAKNKSYEELALIVKSGDPKYTFGEEYSAGFIEWLKYSDSLNPNKTSFDNILTLLEQPYAKQTWVYYNQSDYIWPATFITEKGYLGWRIWIDENGHWSMYIKGD